MRLRVWPKAAIPNMVRITNIRLIIFLLDVPLTFAFPLLYCTSSAASRTGPDVSGPYISTVGAGHARPSCGALAPNNLVGHIRGCPHLPYVMHADDMRA